MAGVGGAPRFGQVGEGTKCASDCLWRRRLARDASLDDRREGWVVPPEQVKRAPDRADIDPEVRMGQLIALGNHALNAGFPLAEVLPGLPRHRLRPQSHLLRQ